jgi:hypothetical protein
MQFVHLRPGLPTISAAENNGSTSSDYAALEAARNGKHVYFTDGWYLQQVGTN